MSYLNLPRLHFSGKFQAATSTVNNDPTHYNNATFKPIYQQRGTDNQHPNGWWNPRGDANWRLIGCGIKSAAMPDGSSVPASDPVLGYSIADGDLRVAAKLVDLDPEQQLVSEIWGLQVRIADANGNTLMRAKYEVSAFMNIWDRWPAGRGDGMASAIYQSVLSNIEWGDVSGSPFLKELKKAASTGLLSIKFNVDAFDANFKSPTFTLGRIAGTIGPASVDEPKSWTAGRQFMTSGLPSGHFFAPAGQVNFCTAVVDAARGKVVIDLGNSFPTETMGGPFINIGDLSLACLVPDENGDIHVHPIGPIEYLAPGWYESTAGVVTLPADRSLTQDELTTIGSNALAIMNGSGENQSIAIAEPASGVYVRADKFVFRMNPGESVIIDLLATSFGSPYGEAEVLLYYDPSHLQGGGGAPPAGTPESALTFPWKIVTDAAGRAKVAVSATAPGNPRGYIDGQVYGVRAVLQETLPGASYNPNPWEYVSFLVYDDFVANPPVWYGCLQPIFQQYANLYPIMDRFLDMSSYDSICENVVPLSIVFGLDDSDPNAMPVTRDLSSSKRKAILYWLNNPGPDGKPLLGTPPPPPPATAALESAEVTRPVEFQAGKLAAMKRRVGKR